MIASKRRTLLVVFGAFIILYILKWIMSAPYEEIDRLQEEIFELKRRNVLRMLHGQVLNEQTETSPNPTALLGKTSKPGVIQIHLPNILDVYPHLVDTPDLSMLNPELRYPDRELPRRDLIMGVPTVQRGNTSYLLPTLEQLFQKARTEDLELFRVVVMISDEKGATSKFVQDTVQGMKDRFTDEFESGLLQVIVPPSAWYPDIKRIPPTFEDKPERMYWRTKQNLDYAYLMLYCARMGDMYLQLEDDIEAAPDYTGTIMKYAESSDWFVLELSTLGYIGKLMRSKEIPRLAVHILLNFKFKPIDWLLIDYCNNRYCSPEMSLKACTKEVAKYRRPVRPAMFQHVGYYSSLSGKIQKLKDRTFKKKDGRPMISRGPSGNPDAKITSSMSVYRQYSLDAVYAGNTIAWLIDPQKDDFIYIEFTLPKKISKITIKTGAEEHKEDIFTAETSVFAVREGAEKEESLGNFKNNGVFIYSVPTAVSIDKIILRLEEARKHWVIIDTFKIEYEH